MDEKDETMCIAKVIKQAQIGRHFHLLSVTRAIDVMLRISHLPVYYRRVMLVKSLTVPLISVCR
jgi:hypothetical protein